LRHRWLLLLLFLYGHDSGAQERSVTPSGTPSRAALALRRDYNGVVAAIDTLVRLYTPARLNRLAAPATSRGVHLLEGSRIVLLIWADDEARVFLNGVPVGETRLTPTRIEIPEVYVEADNVLTAQCWDTDRVESGFMAGLYLENDEGLRPILTTAEGLGWEVASGEHAGTPAQEIFYAHSQPDLPSAEVMWGPQLFGTVDLQVRFTDQDVLRAARRTADGAVLPAMQEKRMEFHESMARLVGLQQRRRELSVQLLARGTRMDPQLRARRGASLGGLSYTLGKSRPLAEATNLAVEQALTRWRRRLPAAQQKQILHEARVLRGPGAATAASPLEPAEAVGPTPSRSQDRRVDYVPPEDRNLPGDGRGDSPGGGGPGGVSSVTLRPSSQFLWRMGAITLLLLSWTGLHGWRGWQMWRGVDWKPEAEYR
jgi:hypothetical protein